MFFFPVGTSFKIVPGGIIRWNYFENSSELNYDPQNKVVPYLKGAVPLKPTDVNKDD